MNNTPNNPFDFEKKPVRGAEPIFQPFPSAPQATPVVPMQPTLVQPPIHRADQPVYTSEKVNHRFTFNGTGGEFFSIWIVNILLTLITFGLYSAWATVRTRRYFYGNLVLDKAAFEYTAKPMQIFKGRLIATLIFLPITFLANEHPAFPFLLFALVFILSPWLIVSSLRFNAKHTLWRNVNFHFNGKVGEATKVYIFWTILMAFTGFLGYPYLLYRRAKFTMENLQFGTHKFEFNAKTDPYFQLLIKVILVMFSLFVGVGILMAIGFGLVMALDLESELWAMFGVIGFIFIYIGFLVMNLWMTAHFAAGTFNIGWSSTRVGTCDFSANASVKNLFWLYLKHTFLISFTFGLAYPWVKVGVMKFFCESLSVNASNHFVEFFNQDGTPRRSAFGDQMADALDVDMDMGLGF